MATNSHDVLIVGGGLIGLSSAYHLCRAGHRVAVVDRDAARLENCSDGCAGMVVPSHFIPLAAPGVIGQGLKWMLNPASPFYLKPRLDPELARWCWSFIRHANQAHVDRSQCLLRDLGLESRRLYVDLADELKFDLAQRGMLTLCRTQKGLDEEAEVAESARELGLEAEVCDRARLSELDPDVEMRAIGGVWFSQDCHLDPVVFMDTLRREILRMGGELVDGEVVKLVRKGRSVEAVELKDGRRLEAETVVVASGVWTTDLARGLGLRVPMQGGKGYSVTMKEPRQLPALCSLLKEGRVAVTPLGGQLRVAGTMEICGSDLSISRRRWKGVVHAFCEFFPGFEEADFEGLEPWSGLRPCSPDGLPFIGRAPVLENVIVATGHSMLGLSLAPITGKLVTEFVERAEPSLNIDLLAPGRFS